MLLERILGFHVSQWWPLMAPFKRKKCKHLSAPSLVWSEFIKAARIKRLRGCA